METLLVFFKVSVLAVWIKAISGLHFPWETCPCCGKKYRYHKKEGNR